jgi:hypothetical protein
MRRKVTTFSWRRSGSISIEEAAVQDLMYVALAVAFFLVALAYVKACEKLR